MSSVVFVFRNIDFLFHGNIRRNSVQTEQPACASVFRGSFIIHQLLTLTQNRKLVAASCNFLGYATFLLDFNV